MRFVVMIGLIASLAPPARADARRFTVLFGERPSGEATVRADGATRDVELEIRDRGTHVQIREHIVLGADGLPDEVRVQGSDGSGPVDEKFTRGGRRGFYVSQSGTPEEYAVLARALLHAKAPLPLLPSGEATLARGETLTLAIGKRPVRVTAYEIAGIDLQPLTVWLDEDLELFAAGGLIVRGSEAAAERLDRAESARETAREKELAARLTRVPGHPIVFEHARLFDAERRRLREGMTVVIDGERIGDVGRDGEVLLPRGAERIDVRGRVLLPGLWDLHVHNGLRDGILFIAAGVTSVRNMGAAQVQETARAFADGSAIGPRQLFVGVLDGRGPNAAATPLLVDNEADVRRDIAMLAQRGYVQAKVYNSFPRALVPAFVDEAHRRGLRASGHVPDGMKALELVRAGVDELQHAYMVLLQLVREPADPTPPSRFAAFAEQAGAIDFASPEVRDFIAELARRHVDVDPTLVAMEQLLTAKQGSVSPVYAAIAARLPLQARRQLEGGARNYSPAAFAATLKLVRALHRAGVPLAFGTDEQLYGFSAQRELELWVQAGIPAAETLYAATLGAARIMGRDRELGSIAPGKLADLVIVDGDPLADIAAMRRPTLVCKGGRLYDPLQLWRALGIAGYRALTE